MALSQNNIPETKGGDVLLIPLAADQVVYAGAIICRLSTDGFGYVGADTANFVFRGIALEEADTTGEDDGDTWILVKRPERVKMYLDPDATFLQADAGTEVTIIDDGEVSKAGVTTNDIVCGMFLGFWNKTETSYGDILMSGYAK